jgi:hypothetical protein
VEGSKHPKLLEEDFKDVLWNLDLTTWQTNGHHIQSRIQFNHGQENGSEDQIFILFY